MIYSTDESETYIDNVSEEGDDTKDQQIKRLQAEVQWLNDAFTVLTDWRDKAKQILENGGQKFSELNAELKLAKEKVSALEKTVAEKDNELERQQKNWQSERSVTVKVINERLSAKDLLIQDLKQENINLKKQLQEQTTPKVEEQSVSQTGHTDLIKTFSLLDLSQKNKSEESHLGFGS